MIRPTAIMIRSFGGPAEPSGRSREAAELTKNPPANRVHTTIAKKMFHQVLGRWESLAARFLHGAAPAARSSKETDAHYLSSIEATLC